MEISYLGLLWWQWHILHFYLSFWFIYLFIFYNNYIFYPCLLWWQWLLMSRYIIEVNTSISLYILLGLAYLYFFNVLLSYGVWKSGMHIMFHAEIGQFSFQGFSLWCVLSYINAASWQLEVSGFCLYECDLSLVPTCTELLNPILLVNAGCHYWTAPSNFPFSSEGWISRCMP